MVGSAKRRVRAAAAAGPPCTIDVINGQAPALRARAILSLMSRIEHSQARIVAPRGGPSSSRRVARSLDAAQTQTRDTHTYSIAALPEEKKDEFTRWLPLWVSEQRFPDDLGLNSAHGS